MDVVDQQHTIAEKGSGKSTLWSMGPAGMFGRPNDIARSGCKIKQLLLNVANGNNLRMSSKFESQRQL